MAKPKSSYAGVRLVSRKTEEKKFQHFAFFICELEEIQYLFQASNSVFDNAIVVQQLQNLFLK